MEQKRRLLEDDASKPRPMLFEGNWVIRLFLVHLNKICDVGGARPYRMTDLYGLSGDFVSKAYPDFKKFFYGETAKKKDRNIFWVMIRSVRKYIFSGGFCFFVVNIIQILTPIFMRLLLNWLEKPLQPEEQWQGYVYASIMASVLIIRAFFSQHAMEMLHSGSTVMGNYVGSLIADKISNLPPGARKYINVGKITNFLTSDIRSLQGASMSIHQLVVTPIILIIYTGMIIAVTSWVGLLTPLVILICVPIQKKLNGLFMNMNKQRLTLADRRAKLINQIITGIKNIKFNAWEKIMFSNIDEIRIGERGWVVKSFVLKGIADAVAKMIPTICTVATIWVYNSLNPSDKLSVGDTFYIITIFNLFMAPINIMLFALVNIASASVSAKRISELSQIIDAEEMTDDLNLRAGTVEFRDASFGWMDINYQKIFEPNAKVDEASMQGGSLMILKNLTTRIEPGSFVVVVGKVGSGKSSFLLACMNEMLNMGGTVKKNGSFAYIPQEAFLMNDSMKNNILFGKAFQEDLYKKAVALSQLEQDLKELPGGEQTEIGERGINLSGGQKQRVLIARAIYAQADINLIDDSLSALDAYVGKKVFDGVFCGVMKGSTRVLVTHHLHILEDKNIDNIIFIDQGVIACEGKLAQIKDNPLFQNYCSEAKKEEETEEKRAEDDAEREVIEEEPEDAEEKPLLPGDKGSSILAGDSASIVNDQPEFVLKRKESAQKPTSHIKGTSFKRSSLKQSAVKAFTEEKSALVNKVETPSDSNAAVKTQKQLGQLTKDETRFEGQVPFSVYAKYLKSGNLFIGSIAILLFFFNVFLVQLANYWAGKWSQQKPYLGFEGDTQFGSIYLGIAAMIFLMLVIRSWCFGVFGSRSSYSLFRRLLINVLRRPMSFFDTTPTGAIMNRCNDDVFQTDFMVPLNVSFFLDCLAGFTVGLLLVVLVLPYLLILVLFFGTILFYSMRKYMRTAVELRRLTQLAVSPLLNRVSESIGGVVTVRAYRKIEWIREKFATCLNAYVSTQIHERLSGVWINFRLELMVAVLVGVTPFMMVLIKTQNWNLSPTKEGDNSVIFGTILTNIFLLGNLMGFFIFSFSEVAKGMSSVQRLVEYIDYKVHERPWEKPRAPPNWPQRGQIEMKNLTLRYREGLPLVIRGLDFSIGAHQKIGIVGRTGSGKSTILLSLMRILEMDEDPTTKQPVGSVEIDGVAIDQIGLHELRKNLVVIPQDPFLIQGTLRFNIDPLNQYSEELILESLRTVQILDSIRTEDIIEQKIKAYKDKKNTTQAGPPGRPGAPSAPKKGSKSNAPEAVDPMIKKIRESEVSEKEKLNFGIDAGGSNLSVGQRQLICIARSLIRKPKILLMDEATANIDQKTDSIIQRVIKENLTETTVITIAHRLITIIQYDKILILDHGEKREEGSPLDLLRSQGYFHKLVKEGGEEFEQKMMRLAQDKSLDPSSL